jgi:hypothetical protein
LVGHTTYDYYVVAWPRMIKETVLPLRWGRGQGGGREKGREGGEGGEDDGCGCKKSEGSGREGGRGKEGQRRDEGIGGLNV